MIWNKINHNEIKDGVYNDMPIEFYHANETHDSSTNIKPAFKSMAHYKAYKEDSQERKTHFDFGNAFELSLTDNKTFKKEVAIYDPEERPEPDKNFGQLDNKKWKQDFYNENENKLIISLKGDDSLDVLTILKSSFIKHETAKTLVLNSKYQTSIFWTCKHTGMKLKTRPDFWKPETNKRVAIISDLKTDKDTTRGRHLKTMCDRDYPVQAVMQIDGLQQSGLINDVRYFWIFSCKKSPYNTEVYEFDSSDVQAFMESYRYKLEEIKRSIDKGLFLSYDPNIDAGIKSVFFPFYYKNKMGVVNNLED